MVCGAFADHGVGRLHAVEGNVGAKEYIKIMEKAGIPSIRDLFQHKSCIFQQDNAPAHTANLTMAFFKDNKVKVMEWCTGRDVTAWIMTSQ